MLNQLSREEKFFIKKFSLRLWPRIRIGEHSTHTNNRQDWLIFCGAPKNSAKDSGKKKIFGKKIEKKFFGYFLKNVINF